MTRPTVTLDPRDITTIRDLAADVVRRDGTRGRMLSQLEAAWIVQTLTGTAITIAEILSDPDARTFVVDAARQTIVENETVFPENRALLGGLVDAASLALGIIPPDDPDLDVAGNVPARLPIGWRYQHLPLADLPARVIVEAHGTNVGTTVLTTGRWIGGGGHHAQMELLPPIVLTTAERRALVSALLDVEGGLLAAVGDPELLETLLATLVELDADEGSGSDVWERLSEPQERALTSLREAALEVLGDDADD